jgi:hypothetical protein
MAAAIDREVLGTVASLLTTELNGLASGSAALGSVLNGTGVYNNTAGSGASATAGDGYPRGQLAFVPGGAFAAAPAANSSIDVWLLRSTDGGATNFESGSATVVPARAPDLVLPLSSASAAAADNTPARACWLPATYFRTLARNNGSGQALPAAGNVLRLLPAADQIG